MTDIEDLHSSPDWDELILDYCTSGKTAVQSCGEQEFNPISFVGKLPKKP